MGWGDSPSPGTVYGPGQPEHGGEWARLCLGRAKFAVLWAGQRAAGCMDNYTRAGSMSMGHVDQIELPPLDAFVRLSAAVISTSSRPTSSTYSVTSVEDHVTGDIPL